MQSADKNRKKCYETPLVEIIEWECVVNICQVSGGVKIDPGFDEEITIPLNQIMGIDNIGMI